MFKTIDDPADCEVRSVIRFLNAKNVKPAEIHRQLLEIYGENVMTDEMVRKWVPQFNDGRTNVHDEARSGRPSVVNDGLVAKLHETSSRNPKKLLSISIADEHPPAHSLYRIEGPGAAIHFKGYRKDQTALARLSSDHLKTFRFSRGDKKFNISAKCNMIEATPQHLLDCVALVYDDLLKRPDFVLEVMKANDLMDLI
ncbi:hypothetical protein AVEN_57161-1 [Araneus ventricosus]|uniref:Mos1 transposase HTH domain-containing protein n=1 Tax=Araneus ventricosus TaxID=182803 RepID=A0A4Y2HFU4_ARAVE|nr:hypothetical protein AVEN_57161-1 [Araneus ventricosus]